MDAETRHKILTKGEYWDCSFVDFVAEFWSTPFRLRRMTREEAQEVAKCYGITTMQQFADMREDGVRNLPNKYKEFENGAVYTWKNLQACKDEKLRTTKEHASSGMQGNVNANPYYINAF